MPPEDDLDGVCEAIADGKALDWDAVASQTASPEARQLLAQLRLVAEIARAHGALGPPVVEGDSDGATQASTGAPHGRWGRYELFERLGNGTFGSVYRAWDPELERYIAVKLLQRRELGGGSMLDRALQEGRALARVRHPNVVSVFGVEVHDDQFGLCMELVEGRTLREVVAATGPMSASEAAAIGQDVCRALAAVHAVNLLHRDVKAHNVMREHGGRVVLMDFGTGQVVRAGTRTDAGLAGTPVYMAPEVLNGEQSSPASDIYGVGVLLFFLVTGRYPYEGRTAGEIRRAQTEGSRALLAAHRPDLPATFIQVIERAIEREPATRYPTAASLLQGLLSAVATSRESSDVSDRNPSRLTSRSTNATGRLALWAGGLVLGCVVLGFFSSWAYSYSLGLQSGFVHEGPLSWLRWGAKSMVAPAVVMTFVSIPALVMFQIGRLVFRATKLPGAAMNERLARTDRWIEERGLNVASLAASVLIACGFLFLAWVVFARFGALLSAIVTPADVASREVLARLSPANDAELTLYRQLLSVASLVLIAGWGLVLRIAARRRESIDTPLVVAGIITVAMTLLLLNIPYRILYQNEAEVASYEGHVCYLTGSRTDAIRLFCPDRQPRSVVVSPEDSGLKRSSTFENIFTRFGER